MHAAFAVLRWTPDTFWRASPRELASALATPGRRESLNETDLGELMQLFPDT
jgi:uncharacterized phage protein (TIGR02216 family)